ncbi:MAG: type II secretion system protein [Clostridium sp.]
MNTEINFDLKIQKKKKKRGFTIIEISVVLIIMVLLMAVFLPVVSGVIEDSEKTGIIGESQTVVFAWQTINSKTDLKLDKNITKLKLMEAATDTSIIDFSKYFNLDKTKNLNGDITVETCMQIVDGTPFSVDENRNITLKK